MKLIGCLNVIVEEEEEKEDEKEDGDIISHIIYVGSHLHFKIHLSLLLAWHCITVTKNFKNTSSFTDLFPQSGPDPLVCEVPP